MKKILRIIFGIALGLIGLGIIAFSVIMLLQVNQWILYVFFGTLGIFGIALCIGAIAIAKGDDISEILSDIFVGMP